MNTFVGLSTIVWENGESIGKGLFAAKDFNVDDYIVEYIGTRIYEPHGGFASIYKIKLGGGWVIDGNTSVESAIFANDLTFPGSGKAPKYSQTNSRFVLLVDKKTKEILDQYAYKNFEEWPIDFDAYRMKVFLRASRPISKNEEIFVRYNLEANEERTLRK